MSKETSVPRNITRSSAPRERSNRGLKQQAKSSLAIMGLAAGVGTAALASCSDASTPFIEENVGHVSSALTATWQVPQVLDFADDGSSHSQPFVMRDTVDPNAIKLK